ncbi:MAG: branched-chain amino acid ABC transporter ATP-binding protein/permease [Aeromicrobium sp.]
MTSFVYKFLSRKDLWILPLGLFVIVLLLPALGYEAGFLRQMILISIYTLIVAGLNLSFGFAGEVVLGQVAILAFGAYTAGILSNHGVVDLSIAMGLSLVVAAVVGLVTGLPGLRLSHMALGLITFFLVLLIPPLALAWESETGGYTGIFGLLDPTFFGIPIDTDGALFFVSALCAGLWLIIFRNLVLSRYGLALRLLKENPLLASSLGQSVRSLRLTAYVVGSLPAGIAGVLFAYATAYVAPTSFTLQLTIAVLAASVVGGAQSVYGAVVGSALLVLGPLNADAFEKYSLIVYGAFLVLVGTVFATGLTGVVRNGTDRLRRALERQLSASDPTDEVVGSSAETLDLTIPGEALTVRGASRSFGEVKAIADVDFSAQPGRITALIGANGAGKTTLLNAIAGAITLDGGTVELGGVDVSSMSAAQRARAGVGRTFQTPMIPASMSVEEVAASGALINGGLKPLSAILRLPAFRRQRREDATVARDALGVVGLLDKLDEPASKLPLSTRRLLEVVRAVAGKPKVLLFDEPAAGMDDDAIDELRALLLQLRDAGATIVLIEHNISFVLGIADDVHVMELGRMIASGTPAEIRADEKVIASYLGSRPVAPAVTPTGGGQHE